MHTHVKVRNETRGPLPIMRTWQPESSRKVHKVVVSTWKKKEDGYHRSYAVESRRPPAAFNLAAGEEVILPRAAANSDQIVGLHRARMISVTPTVLKPGEKQAEKPEQKAEPEVEVVEEKADEGKTEKAQPAGDRGSRTRPQRRRNRGESGR